MSEIITNGYSLYSLPCPNQTFVHITAGLDEVAKVYQPDLGINSSMNNFAENVKNLFPKKPINWSSWTEKFNETHKKNIQIPGNLGPIDIAQIICDLSKKLPHDTIITNGAGNFSNWVHRFYCYRNYPSQLAPQNGSMGYGVPAAVAAKLVYPEK